MQLYVADYLGDTRHLTTEQHGAYLLLLMTMWRSDGRLENDPKKLARITCCTPSRWARISAEVMAFFDIADGCLTHGRLMLELEKASEKSNQRAVSGSLGGKANALKNKKLAEANAPLLPLHSSESEPEKKDSPLPPKGEAKKARQKATSIPDGFPDLDALRVGRELVMAAGVNIHVRTEAEKFRDYAAGRGWKKIDWLATWRNWIRSACERAPSLGLVQTAKDEHDPWPMRMRAWSRQEGWNDVDWGPEPFEPGCRVPAHHLPSQAAE